MSKAKLTQMEEVLKEVAYLKGSNFHATAVKVECEAQINRNFESAWDECSECDGRGIVECPGCEGCSDDDHPCEDCSGYGEVDCLTCDGEGRVEGNRGSSDEDIECQIRDRLSTRAKEGLVYLQCYNDHSVDTEVTFTTLIDYIDTIPEVIQAFKDVCSEVGDCFELDGAGMHTSILNSPNGNYPSGNTRDMARWHNFKRSMIYLLPALYVMSASDPGGWTRPLTFRPPHISDDGHHAYNGGYGCIEYNGSIEFRCFDTCYDRPEQWLDYFITIARCMKFYTKQYRKPNVKFAGTLAINGAMDLNEMFLSADHQSVVNQGLAIIKPTHKTVTEIKQERGYKNTLNDLNTRIRKLEKQCRKDWLEVKERQMWNEKYVRACAERDWTLEASRRGQLSALKVYGPMAEHIEKCCKGHQSNAKTYKARKDYIADKIKTFHGNLNNFNASDYRLQIG